MEDGHRNDTNYYKYWGEKYGERLGDREKRGEKDKGVSCLTFIVFSVLLLILGLSFLIMSKMATMVMLGDEICEKLWAIVNTYFHALFLEYRELYAPSDKGLTLSEAQEHRQGACNKRPLRGFCHGPPS
jgi:hypothetical protein